MKMADLFENDSSSNSNLRPANNRYGDKEEPRKKKLVVPPSDAVTKKARLLHLRGKVAALKKFGDSGDFSSIDAKELARAPANTVLAVYDNRKTYPEKSYVKIGTVWISLADGSMVKPIQIVAQGKKLGDNYGWSEGHMKL